MKELKLDVVKFENEDVIATSGTVLCTNTVEDCWQYVGLHPGTSSQYDFKGTNNVTSDKYIGENYPLYGTDGSTLINSDATKGLVAGNWYHYDLNNNKLYLCNNEEHHSSMEAGA